MASRTMPKAQTGEPLFSLAFSAEAVLPSTVVFPTLQAKCFEEDSSGRSLLENVDLLEEYRAKAHLWTLAYKKVVVRLYNQRVQSQQEVLYLRCEIVVSWAIEGRLVPKHRCTTPRGSETHTLSALLLLFYRMSFSSPQSLPAALLSSLQHYLASPSAAFKRATSASKLVAHLSAVANAFGPTPNFSSRILAWSRSYLEGPG
ncbi:hypothetical protein BHM03_00020940 [Ensete ventricosum]|nr:hypothetical protein BHM03_00020940 [Ensete ventricosum]